MSSKHAIVNKNYISLDLGSETMAACCQLYPTPKCLDINLQEYASVLLGADEDEIDYHMVKRDGKEKKSERLRTLIGLVDRRQPEELKDDHAKLDFIDDEGKLKESNGDLVYHQSLFEYFYKKREVYTRRVMPNPKIPFQEGAGEIIPKVESENGKEVLYEPEILLQHLMTQVIRNFVSKSSEFRKRKKRDENNVEIEDHLILTIPNVYSVTHAQNIKNYVNKHTEFKNVEILYESDAVAYYVTDAMNRDEQFRKFSESLKKRSAGRDGFQILTFDIGHGTTDLSLIEIKNPKGSKGRRKAFYVKGRAGKSHGGNRINYILAKHYNKCLEQVLAQSQFEKLKTGFDFLQVTEVKLKQGPILESLEKLIFAIKKNITEKYEITLAKKDQRRYIDTLVDRWLDAIDVKWQEAIELKFKEKKERENNADINYTRAKRELYNNFREQLKQAFLLEKFPSDSRLFLSEKLKLLFKSESRGLAELKSEIRKYVKENVADLLNNLADIAASRELKKFSGKSSLYVLEKIMSEKPTVVVVAGQASHFKPIKEAIRDTFSKLNLPTEQLIFLADEKAKMACSRGAIIFKTSGDRWANPGELHGTYGFISSALDPGLVFKVLDTGELNSGKKVPIDFDSDSCYWFFYSPRAHHTFNKNPPGFFDGSTALIRHFFEMGNFSVRYNKNKCMISVNGLDDFKVSSYGEISESIYPKVWPVALKPKKT